MQTISFFKNEHTIMISIDKQTGSMMLLVIMLMSIVLVLCTRMWRSTTYVIDIAVQKQVYMQKKWAVRGLLSCGARACKTDFSLLQAKIKERGTITVPVASYAFDQPHVASYTSILIFKGINASTLLVTAQLKEDKKIIIEESLEISTTNVVA